MWKECRARKHGSVGSAPVQVPDGDEDVCTLANGVPSRVAIQGRWQHIFAQRSPNQDGRLRVHPQGLCQRSSHVRHPLDVLQICNHFHSKLSHWSHDCVQAAIEVCKWMQDQLTCPKTALSQAHGNFHCRHSSSNLVRHVAITDDRGRLHLASCLPARCQSHPASWPPPLGCSSGQTASMSARQQSSHGPQSAWS